MIFLNNSNMIISSSANSTNTEVPNCESYMLILIMKIQPIFLIIFGFVANLCSFVVLMQPRLRRRPTFSYLAFLSLSNAFLSLIYAFFTISGVYFGYTLEHLPLFLYCRLLSRFLTDFLTHFSLYTLTAVDLDRVRSVTSKTNDQRRYSRGINTRINGCSRAFLRVCLIELSFASVLFFLNLHWLTSYGYIAPDMRSNYREEMTMCTISNTIGYSKSYAHYLSSILPIIELILFGIVPFLISLVATIIILRHVSIKYTFVNSYNKQLKQSRRRMELHLSLLLISLNCVFILFTTPHNIFNVYVAQLHQKLTNKEQESEGELCSIAFTQKSLDLLQQCYFMSTFFLYILTNKRFREEFYRLFKCFIFLFRRNKTTNNSTLEIPGHPKRIINNNNHHHQHHVNPNYLQARSYPVLESCPSISDASQDHEPALTIND